ncbi:MAG TPA: AmmeMemoRadiSam system protein B [Anaerolineaceae bacterium]|uniref:MEMO1 family protein n=1 Tax=Anaerolinea thermophila TaxID=167964 RepID=A0A117LH05_9CHLR|nr:MAG: hypothetical protein XD73_0424 [Anaerolinea thermophila]HAF60846.1 AmmeMemoRadiSam system protein B [Anaerolineaceae bacterium]
MLKNTDEIRPSAIAGTWYSDDAKKLQDEISTYIMQAKIPPLHGRVIGLISPHAGYRYSGPTAGYAYRAVLEKQFDIVAIFSPFHAYTPVKLLTSAHAYYQTPLGLVPVAQDLVNGFQEKIALQGLNVEFISYDEEHSLEIQLPFLQTALKGSFELFPLMVRTHDMDEIETIAQAAADITNGKNVLWVASTDLSHFYNQKTAAMLDDEMLRRISTFSPQLVLDAEKESRAFACGAGAVAVVLSITRKLGATTVQILHYSTSAEGTGDTSSVVGYGAATIES